MLTVVSRLCFALIVIVAVAAPAPRAAGLFSDPFTLIVPLDTARTAMRASQSELDCGGYRASLLSVSALFRKGSRARVECAVQFPTVRRSGDIAYGLGDCFVSGSLRIAGDTLDVTGLRIRGDLRVPTGAQELVPFCYSSFDGGAGLEARAGAGDLSAVASAIYTLAGNRVREETFVNEHHLTLVTGIALSIPRVGRAEASYSWTGYRGGGSQETAVVAFERSLSAPIAVEAAFAVQSASGVDELYEWFFGLSISYRFSPRASRTPHPANAS